MPTVEVNGTTIHYEAVTARSGAQPVDGTYAALVIHGWPGTDHTYLRPGLDALADRVPVVYIDQRGHGRSGRPSPEPITVEQLADDAGELASTLGFERVVAVGHFHGASVAQELALRHPSRVAALVLVAATPGELGSRESLADAFAEPVPTPPEVEILQRVPPGDDDEWAATMRALEKLFFARGETPVPGLFDHTVFSADAAVRLMQAMSLWTSVDRLPTVEVPTLLVTGAHDVFSPPFQARRIARQVPRPTLKVFEDSGHVPWIEEPQLFTATVVEWLDEVRV